MIATGPLIRRRIAMAMIAFFVLYLVLAARLFDLQVLQAEELQARAQAQWTSESTIAPARGTIYDRNGNTLAMSATAYIASVSPRQVKDARRFAQILAPILNMDEETIYERASDTSKGGVTLKRQLSREIAQQLRAMLAQQDALTGLYLEEDSKRYYPLGEMACQLIGLTTIDGVGQAGLEMALDKYLSGKAGVSLTEIDGRGRELSYGANEYIPAVDGGSVVLTLDSVIQSFAEKAARECMNITGAKAVRVLAMQPQTGEILAMVNLPGYDLNDPPREDVSALTELMRNRLITDAYEPGSTFKILTSAAALDAGLTNVNEDFYCSGSIKVDGGTIRCWGNPHGAETMAQALCNSCNPVFVELGLRLGVDTFYDYLDAFGLGAPTGVDIPGEASGILISRSTVKRVDIARIGFGQSVAVTPLQLLTAASAAVNGGNLMRPYVVKEVRDAQGNVLEETQPLVVSQPIRPETSATMRSLLENVVTNGGGRNAYAEGYRIGGKTGTAQIYVDGVISSDMHIGSFIGFAPMDDPQIAVLFIVDEATQRPDYGSTTAAPYAKEVLTQSLKYLGFAPEIEQEEEVATVSVPDVTGMTVADAAQVLREAGFSFLLDGTGTRVTEQLPAGGVGMAEHSLVMLYVTGEEETGENAVVAVPDVTGLSVSEANRMLLSHGFTIVINGSGVAVSQSPAANEQAKKGTKVRVVFEVPE